MSFVSIIAREHFLSVVSEGRVSCDGKPTGEERFKKFFRVDKNFVVTFAGDMRTLAFLDDVGLLTPNDGNFKALAEAVLKRLQTEPYRSWNIYLGMGGVNSDGLIEFYAMGPGGTKLRHLLPTGDKIDYVFFHLDDYSMDLPRELNRLIKQTGFRTPAQMLQAQKLLNDSFAQINPTMNRNTFQAVVTRAEAKA